MSIWETVGCAFGLLGAFLLALNSAMWSPFGFGAFLVSNLAWLRFAGQKKQMGLFVMTTGFTLTSILGLYRWWLA